MQQRGDYVVEVTRAPSESAERVSARVADLLRLSPERAAALVARVPGVITRGLPEERAVRVVMRLQAAGLSAIHRRACPDEVGARAGTEPSQQGAAAPGRAAAPDRAASEPPPDPTPRDPLESRVELAHDPVTAPPTPPEPERRDPTGFDAIPSLDATQVDVPAAQDPKLTPMREAGFGAADVVLPTDAAPKRRTPSLVDLGSVSLPLDAPSGSGETAMRASGERAAPDGDDAAVAARRALARRAAARTPTDPGQSAPAAPTEYATYDDDAAPTMVMPASAEPPPDAGDLGRAGRRTLTDADLRLTPPPGSTPGAPVGAPERSAGNVAYRSTGGGSRRSVTLTPPPDEVLKRSGVHERDLSAAVARRRGRFGRRLSTLVTLPVTLSWVLSATFLYLLLPEGLRDELWVPLAAATAVAALAGALAAGLSTSRIANDVVRLRDDANRIAMGELESPVRVRRDDELGDLAASLDRMRVSLQEALGRLRRRS